MQFNPVLPQYTHAPRPGQLWAKHGKHTVLHDIAQDSAVAEGHFHRMNIRGDRTTAIDGVTQTPSIILLRFST